MKTSTNKRKIAKTVVRAAAFTPKSGKPGQKPGKGSPSNKPEPSLHLKRILVPLDFSETSEKALSYAASLAREFGAKISLLHVWAPVYYAGDLGMVPDVIPTIELTEKYRERLGEIGRRHVRKEVLGDLLVRDGSPFDEICNAARESDTDLIVIATHGRTGLKHVFLGSTAERVVRHAPCPVLIVRERGRDFV